MTVVKVIVQERNVLYESLILIFLKITPDNRNIFKLIIIHLFISRMVRNNV